MSEKCLFGSGKQEMAKCSMIYIHWPGYYPGEANYLWALTSLCPNITPELKKEMEEKIKK